MSHNRFLALLATAATLAGCGSPTAPNPGRPTPSARLGTVAPAYPVGADLGRGVDVLASIPTVELSTSETSTFDAADPCASVPEEVITAAGLDATPVLGSEVGCVWRGSGLGLEIGALPVSMAKEVEDHLAMANGGSTDRLAHLAWLRIDGHYAIERILEFDPAKSCWLSLDQSAPTIIHVTVFPVDPTTGEPVESDPETSVKQICPITRTVAKNLLDHLDDDNFWEWPH